jgi:hypothetical protein
MLAEGFSFKIGILALIKVLGLSEIGGFEQTYQISAVQQNSPYMGISANYLWTLTSEDDPDHP